jgi:hypothetical protein
VLVNLALSRSSFPPSLGIPNVEKEGHGNGTNTHSAMARQKSDSQNQIQTMGMLVRSLGW